MTPDALVPTIRRRRQRGQALAFRTVEVAREHQERRRVTTRELQRVSAISIRKSTFGIFVFVLSRFAVMDSIMFLPTAVLANTLLLLISAEQFALEQASRQKLQQIQQDLDPEAIASRSTCPSLDADEVLHPSKGRDFMITAPA